MKLDYYTYSRGAFIYCISKKGTLPSTPPISFSKGVLGVKEPFSVVGTFTTPLVGFLRVSLNLPYAQQ